MLEIDGKAFCRFQYPTHFAPRQIDEAIKHIRLSKKRGLPQLQELYPREGKCIIVGAAPSVKNYLDEIRAYKGDSRNFVFAVNETHDWLIDQGIVPNGAVVFEVSKELLHLFKRPHKDVFYFISSMCHPAQYRALLGHKMLVWHPFSDVKEHVKAMLEYPCRTLVVGGSTTLLRTIAVGVVLGFRDFELYGADSSFDDDSHLSGMSKGNGRVFDVAVTVHGEVKGSFKSFEYLIRQADEFKDYCATNHRVFKIRVHGKGLLPCMHRSFFPEMYENAA